MPPYEKLQMKHLTYEQRYTIEQLLARGFSQTYIAEVIGVHKSTISRELKRISTGSKYVSKKAHRNYLNLYSYRKRYKITQAIKHFIWLRLEQKDSPEQIAIHVFKKFKVKLSHESIYLLIYSNAKYGGNYYKHLRHRRKKRRKRLNKKHQRGKIPNRISIHERPDYINNKTELGHWEIDTIVGKGHKTRAITMVERQSKYTLTAMLENTTKEHVAEKIIEMISKTNISVKSITSDNGLEFAEHQKVSLEKNITFYFADAYSPWQRGLNENTNGLIRQFIPKGTEITEENLEIATNNLNKRIRKNLNWKSPNSYIFEVAF